MAIEITGRHVDVTESMRHYAEKRVGKLEAEFPRADKIHVILDVQKYVHMAEVIAHMGRQVRVEAKAESDSMYASIDDVVDKVEKQLRRALEKRHEHKGESKLRDIEPVQASSSDHE
jgi:putative sigma-54 modulation protein